MFLVQRRAALHVDGYSGVSFLLCVGSFLPPTQYLFLRIHLNYCKCLLIHVHFCFYMFYCKVRFRILQIYGFNPKLHDRFMDASIKVRIHKTEYLVV